MKEASESDAARCVAGRRRRATMARILGVALASIAMLIGAAIPAMAAEMMRVTFVRHGESAGNASGLIDTSTPGPVLTVTGQQQAQDVVGLLGDNNYDGIYASTMVRTQLTAAPMSQYLRLPIQVLAGLQEIEAGVFEGTPESQAASGYGQFPLAWALANNRDLRIPGSIDGNEFDARMDAALKTIYENGGRNSIVFSHGGAIMFWTMMNAQNLTSAQKIDLLRTAALGNTDYVVVEGNPEDGWTLVNWNGRLFSTEPTYRAELKRQVTTLKAQLAATRQQIADAFASKDFATIATALNRGFTDASFSVAKFHRAMRAKLIHDLDNAFHPETATSTETAVSTLATTTETVDASVAAKTSTATTRQALETTGDTDSKDDATIRTDADTTGDHTTGSVETPSETVDTAKSSAIESDEVSDEAKPRKHIEEKATKNDADDSVNDSTDNDTSAAQKRPALDKSDAASADGASSDDAGGRQRDAA